MNAPLSITFKCFGLTFNAEVSYTPGTDPSCDDPGDNPEVEFITLTSALTGLDAMDLLGDPGCRDKLEAAAIEACEEQVEADRGEAELDAYLINHPEEF